MSNLQYRIHGTDLQYIEIALQPGEQFMSEQGAMMFSEKNVDIRAVMGDGSRSGFGFIGRFWRALKRSFTGESFFSSQYTNNTQRAQVIGIAAPAPGSIIAIDLDQVGGSVICQKGAYLAGEANQRIEIAFQKRIRVGFLGGEGFVMQRISGSGIAFINATGAVKKVTLTPQQSLNIDTGCLIGVAPTVRYDIKYTGSLKTSIFGGEGLFYANVSGPGDVWMQSLPIGRLSQTLMGAAVAGRGSKGSLIGKLYVFGIILFVIFTIASGGK